MMEMFSLAAYAVPSINLFVAVFVYFCEYPQVTWC